MPINEACTRCKHQYYVQEGQQLENDFPGVRTVRLVSRCRLKGNLHIACNLYMPDPLYSGIDKHRTTYCIQKVYNEFRPFMEPPTWMVLT
jgi:hypothetical protein